MRESFGRAITNIVRHGDTDIFPFPIENHVFYDKRDEIVDLLMNIDVNFDDVLTRYPPSNYSALAPISYTGFRWATQLDPLWNAYFLGVVISIVSEIENTRISKEEKTIFSYRYQWDPERGDLFDQNYNWRSFMEQSLIIAADSKFIVSCDISEFYPRMNHHRLENALAQLRLRGNQPSKIMKFLSNFSGSYSFGIPIGGPASRILSELSLNQIDRLLRAEGIKFCRFADDYHIFCDSYEKAITSLLFLSEKLVRNQGLQLQKAKTRIMSGQEFIATSPLSALKDEEAESERPESELKQQSQNLLRFSIRFDPYSPTAAEDYEALRAEIEKHDIISLLKAELSKSRIHISLSRKIVSLIRFINEAQRDDAVLSLIENADLLYPIYSNVLQVAKTLYDELEEETQAVTIQTVRQQIRDSHHVIQPELNLAYAVRLLSCAHNPENEETLNKIYNDTQSTIVRRDIILTMAKWRAWYWISNLKNNFQILTPSERRAFIIASFSLSEEGGHWRDRTKDEFSPFESVIRKWASEKVQIATWSIPI